MSRWRKWELRTSQSAFMWWLMISELSITFYASYVGEGCRVTVVPAQTTSEDVLALKPDGVFLSNGPGDPEPCTYAGSDSRLMDGSPYLAFAWDINLPASRSAEKPSS